ncbi:hypothetical protein MNV49_005869 [Pseudohyphozyma bogoriensis]|nr:hypothetical protein MNV49_005869 [Pseudohyphozyma bogoriensis]
MVKIASWQLEEGMSEANWTYCSHRAAAAHRPSREPLGARRQSLAVDISSLDRLESSISVPDPSKLTTVRMSGSSYLPLATSSPPERDSLPLPVTTPGSSSSSSSPSYPPPPRLQSALERLASARKGKAKAVDEEAEMEGAAPTGMSFSVRFTSEGEEDLLDLWVGEKATVREVKRRIRFLRPNLNVDGRPRRLRLIQLGRLLTDGIFLVPYTVQLLSRRARLVKEQSKGGGELLLEGLEAVGREIGVNVRGGDEKEAEDTKGKGKGKGKGKAKEKAWDGLKGTEAEEDNRVWLHCSVGEVMEDDEIEGERVQTSQITPLQGFDRLRDAGFSDEDIASMREEFRASAAATLPAGADEDEHVRALEDQWMEGLSSQASPASTVTSGPWVSQLKGLCLGFFFPFIVFVFWRGTFFNQEFVVISFNCTLEVMLIVQNLIRMKSSIVAGALLNFIFALMRFLF